MLPDIGQTSSEQADLYKDVQVFGPKSLQRGIRALNEEYKDNFAEQIDEQQKKYNEANKEKISIRNKLYYQAKKQAKLNQVEIEVAVIDDQNNVIADLDM